MILGKIWRSFTAQLNKLANIFWKSDPIAQLQYEYDSAVAQMKEGREGLEQQRAIVERTTTMHNNAKAKAAQLESRCKAFLQAGDRDTAAKYAMDLQKAKADMTQYEDQLAQQDQVYNNNLAKIKGAGDKLAKIKEKINQYDADLKMSKADAEMAKLATEFNFDVSTDFGQVEQVIQEKIALNKAKARVAADVSSEGLEEIKADQKMQKVMADQALKEFEAQLGLSTPETAKTAAATKELGPAAKATVTH